MANDNTLIEYEVGHCRPPIDKQWKPGQSGNPGGQPQGTPKVSVALMRLLRTNVQDQFKVETRADAIAARLFKSAMEGDTIATKELLNRTEGAVRQALDISAPRLATSEIESLLLDAFQSAGVDELSARKVLLQLTAGGDE